ncbi:helix-turn-helix transcriptional regulator [Granulicella sp. L60]|jgi:transcriptional regulator with XRE-family HTH domain|uniref:helix-turn-helix domain-containing protein n=1 Tax=Granulicella sp. L60 TaxID=1641866 RepID=UPI00131D7860|nr:helix-turn-helix transcriptional regulator [Granulicella sp. L60]
MIDLRLSPTWLAAKAKEEDGVQLSVGGWISELSSTFTSHGEPKPSEPLALAADKRDSTEKLSAPQAAIETSPALPVFGQFLNLSRREKGWSVQQLAGKLNVEPESLVRLENGQPPQPMLVSKIAKVFELPPKSLLQIAGHATAEKTVADAAFAFAARSNTRPLDAEQRAALKEFVKALASQ